MSEEINGGNNSSHEEELTFWDHLEVLRWSLVRSAVAFVICFIVTFALMPHIFDSFILGATKADFFLYDLMSHLGLFKDVKDIEIININVASQFMTHISTSLWMAFIISFPIIIYEVWKFIRPALFKEEEKYLRRAFSCGTLMFYLGCAVGYCIIFPFTFRFLSEYQISPEITNQINLASYIGTFIMMIFVMGLVFEMPLLAWILSKLGLVDKAFLKKYKKHAVVVLLILAAVITPTGDPFTLSLVFIPLYVLYELSIRVVN